MYTYDDILRYKAAIEIGEGELVLMNVMQDNADKLLDEENFASDEEREHMLMFREETRLQRLQLENDLILVREGLKAAKRQVFWGSLIINTLLMAGVIAIVTAVLEWLW